MITANIDTNKAFLAFDTLRDAMLAKGMDADTLVSDQTRLLSRTCVNFIPPIKARGSKGSARLNGEFQVEKEMSSLFSEADPKTIDEIGSLHGIHNVDAWLTKRDGSKLEVAWDNIDPEGTKMPEYHNKYRTKRGTVKIIARAGNRWNARVVVPKGSRKPYVKLVQSHVGRGKASISLVGQRLGDKYPAWIYRHNDYVISHNTAVAKIDLNGFRPSITFGSRAPGITRLQPRFQAAVSFRAKVMVRRAKLILSDYKDWRTVRAKANARKGRPSEPGEPIE